MLKIAHVGTCPPLGVVRNGQWFPPSCAEKGQHDDATWCTLICSEGYHAVGWSSIKCDTSWRKWSSLPGGCEPNTQHSLPYQACVMPGELFYVCNKKKQDKWL